MNRLKALIENIYSGVSLNSTSKFVYDQDKIMDEYSIKNNSRFRLTRFNYCPYVLSESFLTRLNTSVIVIPNLWNAHSWEENNLIVESNQSFVTIYDSNHLSDLTYEGDITTQGLLAVRYGKCFGNEEFRRKIEHNLIQFRIPKTVGNKVYYINDDVDKKIKDFPEEALKLVLPKLGFYWRD